jgi:hypothetical protein
MFSWVEKLHGVIIWIMEYEFSFSTLNRETLCSPFLLSYLSVPLFSVDTVINAVHSGRAVYGMNCLRSLKHRDRSFESHSRYGYLRVFILQLAALRRADPPSKEPYRLYIRLRNWKRGQGPTKDCKATDEWINMINEWWTEKDKEGNCHVLTEALLQHFPWQTEESNDKPQTGRPMCPPRFEPRTFRRQVHKVTTGVCVYIYIRNVGNCLRKYLRVS